MFKRMFWLCMFCLLAASVLPNSAAASKRQGCGGAVASALSRGGFSGALPCGLQPQGRTVKLTKAGSADVLGTHYAVYRYVCKFKSGATPHNVQRVVIFRDGDYLGNYRLGEVASASVKVNGSSVSLVSHDKGLHDKGVHAKGLFGGMAPGRTLTFDLRGGPPPNIWFAGQLSDFER